MIRNSDAISRPRRGQEVRRMRCPRGAQGGWLRALRQLRRLRVVRVSCAARTSDGPAEHDLECAGYTAARQLERPGMSARELNALVQATLDGSMPFPEIVGRLIANDVESYLVDYASRTFTF